MAAAGEHVLWEVFHTADGMGAERSLNTASNHIQCRCLEPGTVAPENSPAGP